MPNQRRPSKLFAGERLRRLRERQGLSQMALAAQAGISASYYNQIEQDQRPLPQPMLRRLCEIHGLQISYFGDSEELHLVGALREATADPLFGETPVDLAEVQAVVRAAPALAHRFMTLYRHHLEREEQVGARKVPDPGPESRLHPGLDAPQPAPQFLAPTQFPYDEVRDWVQSHRNYFDRLDRAAEALVERLGSDRVSLRDDLVRTLRDDHRLVVAEEPGLLQHGLVWRLDRAAGQLLVAQGASRESGVFWLAHNLGLLEQGRTIDRLVREAALPNQAARSLARIALGNYFAGAVMMPYRRFLEAARSVRYDIQLLQGLFGASFEQVAHRLSTLQRPGDPGVPFYFVKTDIAGNVLKRASATRFQFAQFGGPCPLWNVYRSFSQPGEISVQVARTPDDVTYLNIARTVGRSGGYYMSRPRSVAVVLGCELSDAQQLVYAAGLDLADPAGADPIGPGYRACPRTDCRHRAVPPIGQALDIGSGERGVVPYRIRG